MADRPKPTTLGTGRVSSAMPRHAKAEFRKVTSASRRCVGQRSEQWSTRDIIAWGMGMEREGELLCCAVERRRGFGGGRVIEE